jgi:phosphate:Na+ symporter
VISLLNIAAGVALILFGVRFLRKGFDRMLGRQLEIWLEHLARKPLLAAVAGFVFGTVAPSSTAQTVLTLQLMRTGKLAVESTLIFLLAANAGISVTVQLIALRFFEWFAIFIVVGMAGFQWLRSDRWRGAAQVCLGLGFLFLAMTLISDSGRTIAAGPEFRTILGMIETHQVMITLFAAVLTVVFQSSTACLGLALGLTATGNLSLALLIPVVLGANLGIGVTAFAAAYSSVEGRWLGGMNLAFKIALIVPALAALPAVADWVSRTPGDLGRQTANFHTAFGLAVLLLSIISVKPLAGFLRRRMAMQQAAAATLGARAQHLDADALSTPRLALANATRATLAMGDDVEAMLENAWRAFTATNVDLARTVRKHDDQIDEAHSAIKRYVGQLSPDAMTAEDEHLQFGLLNFANQLEVIADLIAQSLCRAVDKRLAAAVEIMPDDRAALAEFYARVHGRMRAALGVLASRDRNLAAEFLRTGDEVKARSVALQKGHYQRQEDMADAKVLTASGIFIDVLNILRRISGLLNTIGHTFLMEPKTALDAEHGQIATSTENHPRSGWKLPPNGRS